jgi:hypothetical protein
MHDGAEHSQSNVCIVAIRLVYRRWEQKGEILSLVGHCHGRGGQCPATPASSVCHSPKARLCAAR